MGKSRTVLLFGELDEGGVPIAALSHFGSEAYEHYMVAPYVRELLMVRNSDYLCWSPCFEYLFAAALSLGDGPTQFEELGSTLYSTIDKFDKLDAVWKERLGPLNMSYVGIEVSQLLVDLAEALHPTAKLNHYRNWQSSPRLLPNIVSRSYQSTSYAFRETQELFDWVSRSRFGIHGIWFSVDGGQSEISAAGNPLTLFDPDFLNELVKKAGYRIRILKSELYSYTDVQFSASWVMLDQLDSNELKKMGSLLEVMGSIAAGDICSLTGADLRRQPYVGAHAGFSALETVTPFDFSSKHLLQQWKKYMYGSVV